MIEKPAEGRRLQLSPGRVVQLVHRFAFLNIAGIAVSRGLSHRARRAAPAACLLALGGLWPGPARADLRLCNITESRVGISLGYRDAGGWVTEGWWNLSPRACDTLLRGELAARFYYIYAVDYDRGGDWSGKSLMCTRDREFTIRGVEDCLARGFDRSGYFEIDTGEQKSWTVQLTDPGRAGTAPPAAPR